MTVETVHSDSRIPYYDFHYKIEKGITSEKNYGLSLAQSIGLPQQVLDFALKVSQDLSQKQEEAEKKREKQFQKMRRLAIIHTMRWKISQAVRNGKWESQDQLLDFIEEAKRAIALQLSLPL